MTRPRPSPPGLPALLALLAACQPGKDTPDPGTDSGADSGATSGTDSGADDTGLTSLTDCDTLPPLPIDPSPIGDIPPAEDFAFDGEGNVILVDERGNLLAVDIDGNKEVILPGAATFASGMRLLPDGDFVYGEAITGTLYRVDDQTGARTALVGGLSYPNGIEIERDGTIFVSEQSGGRVRSVNPDTGAYEIIAVGLYNPNGLSLSADHDRLYIGSFGGGVIWAIDRDGAGWSSPRVYATTPDAPVIPENPCQTAGQSCSVYAAGVGTCQEQYGQLLCLPDPDEAACAGRAAGDACTTTRFGEPLESACAPDSTGTLSCARADAEAVQTCLDDDPACTFNGEEGACSASQEGIEVCYTSFDDNAYIDVCADLAVGDPCRSLSNLFPWEGHCQDASVYGIDEPICLPDDYILDLHGGLDGLNVDACDNLYVTEYLQQTVWRFDAEGAPAEMVSDRFGYWIPNMHFGNGTGPWDTETLYVMDMERGLSEVPLGVDGHGDAFVP